MHKETSFLLYNKRGRTFDDTFFFLSSGEEEVKPVELALPKLHVRLTVSFEHLCYVVIDFSWLLISKLYASG